MDSLSTIALGLNHDPENTVRMLAGQMSARGDTGGLKQSLQEQLDSDNTYDQNNAKRLSTILTCIENNADDRRGAGQLAAAMGAFASCRQGDTETARREAARICSARIISLGRPAALAYTVADVIHDYLN